MVKFEYKIGVVVDVNGVSIDDGGRANVVNLFSFSITKLIWLISIIYFLVAGLKPATMGIMAVIGLLANVIVAFILICSFIRSGC